MKTITINTFGDGMASDIYGGGTAEFSVAKHFDIFTYPFRLLPLRGMTADTTNTGIGNITVASSDGLMYGSGEDASNPGNGKLWQRSGYGGTDLWQSIPTTNQLSATTIVNSLLLQYRGSTNARNVFWSATNKIVFSDPLGGSSADSQALTFSTISQAFVHPKDNIMYFGYQTGTGATYVGFFDGSLGSPSSSGNWNFTALPLPKEYRIYHLTNYGNYLAILCTSLYGGKGIYNSVVYLWDRDTSNTVPNESIPWGEGNAVVLNNLGGILVGISTSSALNLTSSLQDYDSLQIKVWNGGAEPDLVKEISNLHPAGVGHPTCVINPNVNFVHQNRLYFSANIISSSSSPVNPSYYGLWAFGKSKENGQYGVTIERMATDAGTEIGVLAAAIQGDFVSIVHTANGTLTYTNNGATSSSTYSATSIFESIINPNMNIRRDTKLDVHLKKKLHSITIHTLPLPTSSQIVMKYRVDSSPAGAWTTVFTKTPTSPDTNLTFYVSVKPVSGFFTDGENYEFRIESSGGAVVSGFSYKYAVLETNT